MWSVSVWVWRERGTSRERWAFQGWHLSEVGALSEPRCARRVTMAWSSQLTWRGGKAECEKVGIGISLGRSGGEREHNRHEFGFVFLHNAVKTTSGFKVDGSVHGDAVMRGRRRFTKLWVCGRPRRLASRMWGVHILAGRSFQSTYSTMRSLRFCIRMSQRCSQSRVASALRDRSSVRSPVLLLRPSSTIRIKSRPRWLRLRLVWGWSG